MTPYWFRMLSCVCAALMSGCAASAPVPRVETGRQAGVLVSHGADSTSPPNADALYGAAVLHASPDRGSWDPDRAARLFVLFLEQYPADPRRAEATDRLALVNEVRALRAELRALKAIDLARPPR